MRRLWSAEELVERWSLGPEELSLLPGKADTSKLGFAAQLAFYKQHARFPDAEADIAPAVIAHLAEQIGVPAAALAGYDWVGRSGRRHRQTILDFLAACRSTRRPRQRSATGLRQRRCRTSQTLTLLPDPGPVGKVPTDLEGCDDEADEAAVFAGVQGAGGCAPSGAGGDAGECCG
jgi:hypothetical protein